MSNDFKNRTLRRALDRYIDPHLTAESNDLNMEETQNLYIHCAAGYRSVIASYLLKRQGIHNLRNLAGGCEKIKEQEKAEIIKETSVLN